MTSLTSQDGKLVVRDGKLGTEQACCCGEGSGSGGCENCCSAYATAFAGTQSPAVLYSITATLENETVTATNVQPLGQALVCQGESNERYVSIYSQLPLDADGCATFQVYVQVVIAENEFEVRTCSWYWYYKIACDENGCPYPVLVNQVFEMAIEGEVISGDCPECDCCGAPSGDPTDVTVTIVDCCEFP